MPMIAMTTSSSTSVNARRISTSFANARSPKTAAIEYYQKTC
jgi:hypothetical protein